MDDSFPNDYYNGEDSVITIVSGNNQSFTYGEVSSEPIVFKVTDLSGTPLINAPITIDLAADAVDGSLVSLNSDGSNPDTIFVDVRTDGNGEVYTWHIPGANNN